MDKLQAAFDDIDRRQRVEHLHQRGSDLLDKIDFNDGDSTHSVNLSLIREVLDALKQEALDAHA